MLFLVVSKSFLQARFVFHSFQLRCRGCFQELRFCSSSVTLRFSEPASSLGETLREPPVAPSCIFYHSSPRRQASCFKESVLKQTLSFRDSGEVQTSSLK